MRIITAVSLMVRSPINLVQGLIDQVNLRPTHMPLWPIDLLKWQKRQERKVKLLEDKGWLQVGAVDQWHGTSMVSQRPWVRLRAAPSFFRILCLFCYFLQTMMPYAAIAPDSS